MVGCVLLMDQELQAIFGPFLRLSQNLHAAAAAPVTGRSRRVTGTPTKGEA